MNHPTLEEYTQNRACTTWGGVYKGVNYTLQFWAYRASDPLERKLSPIDDGPWIPHGIWNMYLLLWEPQWPDFEQFICPRLNEPKLETRGRKMWDYMSGVLAGLPWPGGISYYELSGEKPYRKIKVGCDYNHAWDARHEYPATLSSVEADAMNCVSVLLDRYTPLVRCKYTGDYGKPEEMIPTKWPGEFILASVKDQVWSGWLKREA